MSYTTIAKIQAMLKGVSISSSTNPSTTDVTNFITEEEAEINSRLSEIYSVPISSTASPIAFAIVGKISTLKISSRIKSILEVQGNSDEKMRGPSKDWFDEAENMLKNSLPTYTSGRIKQEKIRAVMPLPDAVINQGQPGVGSSVTNSSALNTATTSKDTFKRNKDNW